MNFQIILPTVIIDKIPLKLRVLKNFFVDVYEQYNFWIHPKLKIQAMHELTRCDNQDSYFSFAQQWLGQGAIQRTQEIFTAIEYIKKESPTTYCEIGTAYGGTLFLMSILVNSLETIIGIDLYVRNKSRLNLFHGSEQTIRLLNGSSYAVSTINSFKKIINGRKLDVLFIDGDHRYAGVKKDFLAYRDFVREGGLIMFHDIVPDHFSRFGKCTGSYVGGVPLLWSELKCYYPHQEFIEDPLQDGKGIGIIRFSPYIITPIEFTSDQPCIGKGTA